MKKALGPDAWGKIIQAAIAVLTVIAGMFFENTSHAMGMLLG